MAPSEVKVIETDDDLQPQWAALERRVGFRKTRKLGEAPQGRINVRTVRIRNLLFLLYFPVLTSSRIYVTYNRRVGTTRTCNGTVGKAPMTNQQDLEAEKQQLQLQ